MIKIRTGVRRAWMRVTLIERIHAQDFIETVMPAAQRLHEQHGRIELLLLDVRSFQGWTGSGAFAAQSCFLRVFGRSIGRVAVFGSRAWKGAVPAIAQLFVAAEVRSFLPGQGWLLRRWLRTLRPDGVQNTDSC